MAQSKTRKQGDRKRQPRKWSGEVTRNSHALDLENRVFNKPPKEMARSLKRSAERSKHRKASPFQSAMSMLNFFENRAGRNLPAAKKRKIHRAKDELRALYGRKKRD